MNLETGREITVCTIPCQGQRILHLSYSWIMNLKSYSWPGWTVTSKRRYQMGDHKYQCGEWYILFGRKIWDYFLPSSEYQLLAQFLVFPMQQLSASWMSTYLKQVKSKCMDRKNRDWIIMLLCSKLMKKTHWNRKKIII